jgi:hypothetical protein
MAFNLISGSTPTTTIKVDEPAISAINSPRSTVDVPRDSAHPTDCMDEIELQGNPTHSFPYSSNPPKLMAVDTSILGGNTGSLSPKNGIELSEGNELAIEYRESELQREPPRHGEPGISAFSAALNSMAGLSSLGSAMLPQESSSRRRLPSPPPLNLMRHPQVNLFTQQPPIPNTETRQILPTHGGNHYSTSFSKPVLEPTTTSKFIDSGNYINAPGKALSDPCFYSPIGSESSQDTRNKGRDPTALYCGDCGTTKELPRPEPRGYRLICSACGGRVFFKLPVKDSRYKPRLTAR